MTTDIGNFEKPQWIATWVTSGGIIYAPLGPDSQAVWGQSTWKKPEGVCIKYPEGYTGKEHRLTASWGPTPFSASYTNGVVV